MTVKAIPLEEAEHRAWPEPDRGLIEADRAPAPVLTTDILPPACMEWCREMASSLACPIDYVAAGLLGTASAWLGNARRIRATPDWIEPSHLWFALIGAPSTGKTPAMRPFIDASLDLEGDTEDQWRDTVAAHERNVERAKAISDQWKSELREAMKAGREPPEAPIGATPPDAPTQPRVRIADATMQEIANILSGNPRGLLLTRDELSGWLGSMDRYGGVGEDRAFYLESWNGGAHTVDRVKNGKPVRVRYASLAILGGLQPDKLKEALSGADDGLAARFIFIYPEPAPFHPLNFEQDAYAEARRALLTTAARRLRPLAMNTNDRGESVPFVLKLAPDGCRLLDDIRREAIERARTTRGLAAGWHGKTPARTLRLALVIEFITWAMIGGDEPQNVTGKSIAYAGAYLDYAALMLERALAGLVIDSAEADAAVIARMLQREGHRVVNERSLYQRTGFSFLREQDRRRKAFDALAEAGFLKPDTGQGRGRPRGDWLVNPRIGIR